MLLNESSLPGLDLRAINFKPEPLSSIELKSLQIGPFF